MVKRVKGIGAKVEFTHKTPDRRARPTDAPEVPVAPEASVKQEKDLFEVIQKMIVRVVKNMGFSQGRKEALLASVENKSMAVMNSELNYASYVAVAKNFAPNSWIFQDNGLSGPDTSFTLKQSDEKGMVRVASALEKMLKTKEFTSGTLIPSGLYSAYSFLTNPDMATRIQSYFANAPTQHQVRIILPGAVYFDNTTTPHFLAFHHDGTRVVGTLVLLDEILLSHDYFLFAL